ncbi:hypothetical protein BGX27_004815, partial [Mortierella sp. AM989]
MTLSFALKMRDVLHYAPPDSDPNEPIKPLIIPPNSAHPILLTFTSKRFRIFWRQERRAHDWEYRAHKFTDWYRSRPKGEDLDMPLPNKSELAFSQNNRPGSRIRYDWTVRYDCRRWRMPGRISRGQIPVGANCKAHVYIRKTVGLDEITLEYHWRHSHPTSDQERNLLPCGRSGREWIKERARQGFDWRAIKKMLRPSGAMLHELERDTIAFPLATRLSYRHARTVLNKHRLAASQKDRDVYTSLKRWVMSANHDIYCMDSTHNAVKGIKRVLSDEGRIAYKPAYLFTLLVKDRTVMKGIPVAFMICPSESR